MDTTNFFAKTDLRFKRFMRFFLILLLLCFNNFGGLTVLVTKFYASAIQLFLVAFWSFLFLLFLLTAGRKAREFLNISKNLYLFLPVIVIGGIFCLEIINSLILGNRSFVDDILKKSFYFLAIIVVFPFAFLFSHFIKEDKLFLEKSVLYFTISLCLLAVIQDFVISFFGGPLFLVTSFSFRNGLVRFEFPNSCNWLVLCYCFSSFFKGKKKELKFLYFSCFALIVLTDVFVVQTRGSLLSNSILLFLILLKNTILKNFRGWPKLAVISTVVVFFCVFLFGFLCYSYHSFVFSLFYPDLSATTRVDGANFFFSSFLRYPFFGCGFLQDSTNTSSAFLFYHGYEGAWIRIDVGLIGFFDIFGCLTIPLYFFVIFYFLSQFQRIDFAHRTFEDICFSIVFFTIVTMPTLCTFDYERFLVLCLCISLVFSLGHSTSLRSVFSETLYLQI